MNNTQQYPKKKIEDVRNEGLFLYQGRAHAVDKGGAADYQKGNRPMVRAYDIRHLMHVGISFGTVVDVIYEPFVDPFVGVGA